MVLVTLGGCHLLDGLVVVSVKALKEDYAVLWRSDCEGYCARPTGAAKEQLLVERVIEIPSLRVGFDGAHHVGLAGDAN